MPALDLTCREAVTLLAAGFTLAVQPVSAGTITTDTTGLVAGEVRKDLRSLASAGAARPSYRREQAEDG